MSRRERLLSVSRLADLGLDLIHRLRARWRGLPVQTRRNFIGLPVSAALHLLLLGALLATPAARQLGLGPSLEQGGRANAHNGRGLSVSLVSLAQLGEIGRDAPATPQTVLGQARADDRPGPARMAVQPAGETTPVGGSEQAGDPVEQIRTVEQTSSAQAAAQGLESRDAVQSGDADAGQNLLRQIGRCLPTDRRPVLQGVTLALHLASDGQLAAAPSLDIAAGLSSQEAIREANLVIQAALQCGPYQRPNADVEAYAVAADFSFMGPPGEARPRLMQRHGR